MATVVRENIGLLNDKLTVKLEKGDYMPSFEKKLKEYSKTANIPGFRKGMVPAGMIKKMYGPSIFNEEVLRGVEKQLYTYLNEEKPEIFAQPLPVESSFNKVDINNPSDYEFGFEIGLKPAFEIANLSASPLTLHKVEVTDAMVDEEISRMALKAGNMTEPEQIDNDENVLNILFTETDPSGKLVEGGIAKENSVLLKYFAKDVQDQLKGKKVGDSIVVTLASAFEGEKLEMMMKDLEVEPAASGSRSFHMEIVKIGLVEKRELNEAFFNEVFPGKNVQDEASFRNMLKEEIEQYWNSQSRNQLHDQIYHALLDNTQMEFPESFLKKWLQTSGEKEKSGEEVEQEFPTFISQLKWTLISDKLIKDNSLDVSEEELREHMRNEVSRYFGNMNMGEDLSWLDSYLDRMMKDEKQVDATYRKMVTEKLFNFVETQLKPSEKTVTPEELTGMQHHHAH